MKTSSSKKKLIIAIVAVLAVICIFLGVYKAFGPKAVSGTKAYTLIVVDNNGEEKKYTGKTDAEFLANLMDELQETTDFSYEGTGGDYGLFIDTVNGLTADYSVDGAYWAIYVNGGYGEYGADSQPVEDGGEYSLVYEVYSAE